ncbi:hypothetical protein HELRODRAFT_153976 [Helobdella robusta]|uniref:Uncharacterized protein n=1 Tax=Helobdella robusta TaxID=6412 RepID=T1ELD4_HELRO|nr:hypothetical protein HELRODRAFT_153976 [Helobdella robusta]ESO12890.1 hypothetical protein HELRODRAFT_153976 [Helobdella robusta]
MILSDTSTAKKTVIPKCPSDFLPNDSQYQWYLQSFKQLSPLTDKKLNKQVLHLNNNPTTTSFLDDILILTPISNVKDKLRHYFSNLCSLTYPHEKLSIVLAEDSSVDHTLIEATALRDYLQPYFKSIRIIPLKDGQPNSGGNIRHDKSYQEVRRKHLSKVRNQMLMSSLEEKFKWVFWLDADVRHIPTNVIEHLLSVNQTIVTANCLYRKDNGELDTFDRNTWQETKNSLAALSKMPEDYLMLEGYGPSKRFFLNDLTAFEYENDDGKAEAEKNIATANNNLANNNVQSRQQNNGFPSIQPSKEKRTTKKVESGRPAELDGVGGCVLLVNADLHRKGLIFPPFLFRHHIETEGMAKMAKEIFGAKIFGLPRVYIVHW